MVSEALGQQLALLLAQAVLVAAILLTLFRLRTVFGLVPIYTTIAIFYQMANLLAATVYIKVTPDLMITPGSVVLFPAILLTVLFIYIREDAREARNLIYALIAADLSTAALGPLIAQHFNSPLLFNPYSLTPDLFLQQPRILIVGTLALYADTILIILVYEFVARYVTPWLFARTALSMVAVLTFDTLLFVTGSFAESPAYGSILLSGVLGKAVAGVVYAGFLTVYLQRFDVADHAPLGARQTLGDLFQVLTYRQKYELIKAQMTRDPLTGVYNRGFFDETLAMLLARARRADSPVTLMMLDIDHFKEINDTYGHRAGDQALQAVAASILGTCRTSDVVCRYGGEEFAILLPDTDLQQGILLGERVGHELSPTLGRLGARWSERAVTATIGLAASPTEADSAEALIHLADRRLYAGKARGRNCVVPSALDAADSVFRPAEAALPT
jgi:diguanylate cyclase (GGDEF)-like protein